MKGTLYQILGNGIEELYWSATNGQEDFIRDSYKEYQEKVDNDEDFEDWFNKCFEISIERIFVEEIYV